MYIEHLRKAFFFFLELPLDDLFIQFEQRLPRDFQWSDSEGFGMPERGRHMGTTA